MGKISIHERRMRRGRSALRYLYRGGGERCGYVQEKNMDKSHNLCFAQATISAMTISLFSANKSWTRPSYNLTVLSWLAMRS